MLPFWMISRSLAIFRAHQSEKSLPYIVSAKASVMVEPPCFHDLDLGFLTDIGIFLVCSLDLSASTNIQTDWSINFRASTWSCFWVSNMSSNFFTQLVDKVAIVLVLLIKHQVYVAWLIIRACKPTWLSQYPPSISTRGTRAAALENGDKVNCTWVNQFSSNFKTISPSLVVTR